MGIVNSRYQGVTPKVRTGEKQVAEFSQNKGSNFDNLVSSCRDPSYDMCTPNQYRNEHAKEFTRHSSVKLDHIISSWKQTPSHLSVEGVTPVHDSSTPHSS